MDENEQVEAAGMIPTPVEVQAALHPDTVPIPLPAGTKAGSGRKRPAAKKTPAKKAAKNVPAAKAPAQKAVPEKAVPEKAVPEKAVPEKAVPEKAVAEKAVPEKAVPEKAATPAKKSVAKQAPAKKLPVKQAAVKQAVVKKAVVKKAVVEQSPAKKTARRAGAPAGPPPASVAPASATPATVAAAEPRSESKPESQVRPGHGDKPGPESAEADVQRAWQDNSLAQVLYHDWEAGTYDEKWSISFDERCITYARDRFSSTVGAAVLRTEQWPYPKALEIGAGTGFFSLNLKQAGVLDEVHLSDVSAGMVEGAQRNARGLGLEVHGVVAGAESLPYPDNTFDLVIGHAVIHHIPDVEAAFREVLRVLRPGGRFVIAGEPTRIGDWYARRLGRVTWKLTTTVTQLPPLREKWAKSRPELDASSQAAALEAVVDLHTFVPSELQATAERAGAVQVRIRTEELLAALVGWPVRTFEAAVNPKALGWGWATFAYRVWQRLSALDRVLARALPESVFYNVGITGIKRYR
jgi:ubiquinone/menaquinone biosynthesis C-methylase UbiE